MADQPLVTIGMPVFNAERFLAESLESLLAQSFADFEIVISDNGSTDNTAEMIRGFAARDARIRSVRSEVNHGAAWNFNRVFELARGKYFRWHAYDDLLAPACLERSVAAMEARPDAVFCHTHRDTIAEDGSPDIRHYDPAAQFAALAAACAAATPSARYREVLLASGGSLDFYGLMRRDAMARTRLHRPYYGADKVFLVEFSLLGPWVAVPETLFHIRLHDQQSVWIPSQAGQDNFVGGAHQPRLRLPRQLRCTLASLGIALGGPVSLGQRARCLAAWCEFVLRPEKWRRLGRDMLSALLPKRHKNHPGKTGAGQPLESPTQTMACSGLTLGNSN